MNNSSYRIGLLTPPGIGAIAVIRLDGSGAFAAINRCFRSYQSLKSDRGVKLQSTDIPVSGLSYGQLYDPIHPKDSAEDVVMARIASESFEINCHGGTAAIDRAMRLLSGDPLESTAGDRFIPWEQWLADEMGARTTAHSNNRTEESGFQEKAAILLTQSKTWKTTAILLDQYCGAWERLQEKISALNAAGQFLQAQKLGQRARQFTQLGRRLTRPWRVALTGRPNAGKSSLLNCLLGFDRAIVNETSGTTRDIVSAETVLDGWPFELIDSAGICASSDPLEREGVQRAIEQIKTADLILLLHAADDSVVRREKTRQEWRQWNVAEIPCLEVIAKSDLLSEQRQNQTSELTKSFSPTFADPGLPVSVKTHAGIDVLITKIVQTLIPETPAPGEAVPLDFDSLQESRLNLLDKPERNEELF